MEQLLNELRRSYAKHKQSLQGLVGKVQALCEEADNLKSEINVAGNGGHLPTAQLESVITEAEQTFPEKIGILNQAKQAVQKFCLTHNLMDKNVQPNPVMTTLQIAIGVFVDAIANSSFLYNAHMVSSTFSALLVSFLISLTNVITSVCAGFFIGRFINYGNNSADASEFKAIKSRAAWQFQIFVGVMAFFILTVGLVRSTESLDQVQHSLANYQELLETPEAVFLMLLNICIACFSFYKGRTGFVHPYGDFGSYQQSVTASNNDLHQSYTDSAETIEDICEMVESDAETQDKEQKKSIERYNKKVTACHNAQRELAQAVHSVENQFSAEVTKLMNTHSVLSGNNESIPDDLLDQFSFTEFITFNLNTPEFYQAPDGSGSDNKAALAEAKAVALQRLGEVFKRALQS